MRHPTLPRWALFPLAGCLLTIAWLVICGDEFLKGKRGRDFKELYRVLSPNGIAWLGQSAATAKAGTPLTRKQLEDWLREAEITTYTIVEEHGIWAKVTRPRQPG